MNFEAIFTLTFLSMELAAWSLHKFVMHGFLWSLHKDHHTPVAGKTFQKNDLFALFFAVPSFLLILFGKLWLNSTLSAIGFGVMAYGVAYFFVHEVIIHRRLKFIKPPKNRYISSLRIAHALHHKQKGKHGCKHFGMLIPYLPQKGRG